MYDKVIKEREVPEVPRREIPDSNSENIQDEELDDKIRDSYWQDTSKYLYQIKKNSIIFESTKNQY